MHYRMKVAPQSGLIAWPPSDGLYANRVIIVSQLETQMQASKAQQLNLHRVNSNVANRQ